jgi:hypothetical protein
MHAFPPVVTPYLPLIYMHIAAGIVAIVAGYGAVTVKKGERVHRAFGIVFVLSMVVLATIATYLAISLLGKLPGQSGNIAAGALVPYLVGTAWVTVRRKEGTIGLFEKIAPFIALGVAATFLFWGVQAAISPTGGFDGYAAGFYYVIASIAALLATLDLKVILQGGISGAARISRHLWRMCFAFFFATGSFFIGQQKVMPHWMHGAWYLYVLALAPLAFMVFWLIRVRIGDRFKGGTIAVQGA